MIKTSVFLCTSITDIWKIPIWTEGVCNNFCGDIRFLWPSSGLYLSIYNEKTYFSLSCQEDSHKGRPNSRSYTHRSTVCYPYSPIPRSHSVLLLTTLTGQNDKNKQENYIRFLKWGKPLNYLIQQYQLRPFKHLNYCRLLSVASRSTFFLFPECTSCLLAWWDGVEIIAVLHARARGVGYLSKFW